MSCLAIYSRSFRYLRLNNTIKTYNFYVKNKLNVPLKDFRIFPSQIRILSSNQDADVQDKPKEVVRLSQKEKLKRAVKEYGSVVIVFHVGISLLSLGGFYLLVANGLDVVSLLKATRFAENLADSKVVMEGSTFVIAYAIHKLFAPVRIAVTLSSSPLIVRYLRRKNIFQSPKTK